MEENCYSFFGRCTSGLAAVVLFLTSAVFSADDHGDTIGTATVVTGTEISGTIDPGDEDWFCVTLEQKGWMGAFIITRTAPTEVSIYDSGGGIEGVDPNLSDGFDGFNGVLDAGTYYVRVEAQNPSGSSDYSLQIRRPALATELTPGIQNFVMAANDVHYFCLSSPPNMPVTHCVGSVGPLSIALTPFNSDGVENPTAAPLPSVPSDLSDCDSPFINNPPAPSANIEEFYVIYANNFGSSGSYGLEVIPIGARASQGGAPRVTHKRPGRSLRGTSTHKGTALDDVGVLSVYCIMKGIGTRVALLNGTRWSTRFSVRKLKRKRKRKTTVTTYAYDIRGQVGISRRTFRIK